MTDTPATPPGWYPDPSDAGREWWWDGTAWTEQTRPAGSGPADVPPSGDQWAAAAGSPAPDVPPPSGEQWGAPPPAGGQWGAAPPPSGDQWGSPAPGAPGAAPWGGGAPGPGYGGPPAASGGGSNKTPLIIIGVIVAALVIGIGAFALASGGDDDDDDTATGGQTSITAPDAPDDTSGSDGPTTTDLTDVTVDTDPADDDELTSPESPPSGDDEELNGLADGCYEGDMGDCDDLYLQADVGSDYEDYGNTCGGRLDDPQGRYCENAIPDPETP